MGTTVNITRMNEERRTELEKVAEYFDRDRSYVLNEAVKEYIEAHRAEVAAIKQGIADIEAGRYKSLEEVRAKYRKRAAATPAKNASRRASARR